MSKFRKKPVVIEAVQFTQEMADTNENVPEGVICSSVAFADSKMTQRIGYGFCIRTLEGDMTVAVDDWIITGVKGERYPCRPDIFEATYDPIPPAPENRREQVSEKTLGWIYFNNSNEEWEWSVKRPADDDNVHSVMRCAKEEFFGKFPNHD